MSTFEDYIKAMLGQAQSRDPPPHYSGMRGMSPEEIAEHHRRIAQQFGSPGDMFSDWMNQPPPGPTQCKPYDEGDYHLTNGPLTDPRVLATMRVKFEKYKLEKESEDAQ